MDEFFDLEKLPKNRKVYLKAAFTMHPAPSDIVNQLNQYVIGQEEAKKALAVTLVNNDVINEHNDTKPEIVIRKTGLLLAGPSGSGKTYLIETLGRILKRKVMIVDITSFTQAGYVGRDVESILKEAEAICDSDVQEMEKMIIFIDEVDKLATSHETGKIGTLAVQQQLLKLIEGQPARPITDNLDRIQKDGATINTRKILWILGGAFTQYREDKKKKLANTGAIGFGASKEVKEYKFDHEALIEAGMIRELAGRIGQVIELHELTDGDYLRILTEPVDSLTKQYTKLGELRGIDLSLTNSELHEIIKEARQLKIGARGLKNVAEQRLRDRMYY